jgi:hypothetical protein
MPAVRGRVLPVLLAATVVVGGANLAAYAANGHPVLLGQKNTATKTTTIKNAKGTVLSLKGKKGKPTFKVSNTEKIKKLNADLVDGLDSTALQNKTYTYNLTGTSAAPNLIRFALPGLPGGKYLVTLSVNAALSGVSPFFGCIFDSGAPFTNGKLPALGATGGGNVWYVSGAGYLDTTALTYTLTCQSSGGTTIVVPQPGPGIPAQVSFTRVDDVTAAAAPGAKVAPSGKGFGG